MYSNYEVENGWWIPADNVNLSLFKHILVNPHYIFTMTNTHESKLTVTSFTCLDS